MGGIRTLPVLDRSGLHFRSAGGGVGPCRRPADRGHAAAHLGVAEREMAGGLVTARLRLKQRLLDGAHLLALPAAGVEAARRRRGGGAGHVAAEDLALAPRAG